MKAKMVWLVSLSLFVSSLVFAPSTQARNTPIAPIKSLNSYIDFDQPDALYAWDGLSSYPTFDFGSEDVEVEVEQFVGSNSINMINIDLPSGFVVTGFDDDDTYLSEYGDTVCNTSGLSLSYSSDGVTAKGFSCSALDGTVEFRFDVDDLVGYITTTVDGSYPIESQFRTAESRKVKSFAYVVETANRLTLLPSGE